MLQLIILNIIILAIISLGLFICKKRAQSKKAQEVLLLVAPLLTIVCHYSSLLYHAISDGKALEYLISNCNLLLPIYPCNVVLWCCVFYGLLKNKESKWGAFLADFNFWFGTISALVGMFANVDFMMNPTLQNFDITKGILAHGFMLFNVLLLPLFGKVRINFIKNSIHIICSVLMMGLIGLYCNLLVRVLASEEFANVVNSMFLLHSPMENVPWLTFPLIAMIGIVLFAILFFLLDTFCLKKGNRFIDRFSPKKT